jgi:hypothetical protein
MITAKEALEKTKEVHKQQIKQLLLVAQHTIDKAASEGLRETVIPIPTPAVGGMLKLQLQDLGYSCSLFVKEMKVFW